MKKRTELFFLYLALISVVFSFCPTSGQSFFINSEETLRISGHYSDIYSNNAPGRINNFHFIALTTPDRWSIAATNDNNPGDWGLMRYDGTNIYTLITDLGNLPPGYTNKFKVNGYIFPGQFYFPEDQDSVHLFLPWMVFHLSPQMIQDSFSRNGVIEMPSPWSFPRFATAGYGSKWKIETSADNKLLLRIDVVRDTMLDLKTEEDELRRATLDYPFTINERDAVIHQISLNKNIPDGFTNDCYECTEVFNTNGLSIPVKTHFTRYYPNFKIGGRTFIREINLIVDEIEFMHNTSVPDIIPPAKTFVYDFRYQATNNRTKFNYATYTLNTGEEWKSAKDPMLLAQANHWLKHGPGYDSHKSKRRIILAGMLFVTLSFSGLLLWLRLKPVKQPS